MPVHRARLLAPFVAALAVLLMGAAYALPARGDSAVGLVSGLSVDWGDSTALVRWAADPSAVGGYLATLVRASDNGIMLQAKLPATQLAWDAQGIWPNEGYFVAVQPLDASGVAGVATVSATGGSVPIARSAYNGFLDQENVAAGSIDSNLWDIRGFVPNGGNGSTSTSFVNNQLHYHLETGQIYVEQSMVGMTARVPVDFTGRTAHIHGEVDLHGNYAEWFAVNLTPTMIAPNQMLDTDDRMFGTRSLPILTLCDCQPGPAGNDNVHATIKLLENVGSGASTVDVAGDSLLPPYAYNNVRTMVDYYVSTSHVTVKFNGVTVMDVALPHALPFSVGYLNLSAESYPKVDQQAFGSVLPCDAVGGACNTWHLDNWGFDAPSSAATQPATTADFSQGCTPPAAMMDMLMPDPECSPLGLNSTSAIATYHIPVANAGATSKLQVLAQSYTYDTVAMQHIQVRLNGGAWVPMAYLDTAQPFGELGSATLPAGALVTGDNTLDFRITQIGTQFPGTTLANVVLQQTRTAPFSVPALPPEPAPVGTWGGGSPTATATATDTPTATPNATETPTPPTPTPSPTPGGTPLNNTPCAVILNGQLVSGTCTGTFNP